MNALLSTLLGVLAGTITGLIPGIHVNLVAAAALGIGVGASATPFLVALAVTHTFLDAIPAVLLGAPESDTALGVLPGHRYLLRGWGYMAVKLTLVGSFGGLLLALALIPLWWQAIKLYPALLHVMGWALLAVSAYMIVRDRQRWWALLVYLASGLLGYLLLNTALVTDPLFPLFSGLFGTSTLLYSIRRDDPPPPQTIETRIKLRWKDAARALGAGNLSGFLTSMLPGLGAAQAAVLSLPLVKGTGDHGFLILLGTINTVNFSLSLLTWLAYEKARNGAVVAIQTLTTPSTHLVAALFAVALLAASIAVPLTLGCARAGVRLVSRVPYTTVCAAVILLITALVFALTGPRGLLVLATATGIGLVPAVVKCSRAHAMGCLMLPVALYFL